MPRFGQLSCSFHRVHLSLAPNKFSEPASGCTLKPGPQGAEGCNLISIQRLADTLDSGRAQRLELEVSFDQLACLLTDRDRSGRCERLQPRCEIGRVADRSVFSMSFAGRDRTHHNLASVHTDARFERQVPGLA